MIHDLESNVFSFFGEFITPLDSMGESKIQGPILHNYAEQIGVESALFTSDFFARVLATNTIPFSMLVNKSALANSTSSQIAFTFCHDEGEVL